MATSPIDFAMLSLRDALDLAVLIEEEARDRYEELACALSTHHNEDAASFFRLMFQLEATHQHRLLQQRRAIYGTERSQVRRDMVSDVEGPPREEVRAGMTVYEALESALRAETRAFEFFGAALERVTDPAVRSLFRELRAEEGEHRTMVESQLAALSTAPSGAAPGFRWVEAPSRPPSRGI